MISTAEKTTKQRLQLIARSSTCARDCFTHESWSECREHNDHVLAARQALRGAAERRERPPHKSRWQLYPGSIVGHVMQGAIAGAAMGVAPLAPTLLLGLAMLAFGIVLLLASACYQWAGYVKTNDSLKRDWRDYLIGWLPTCPACLLISAWFLFQRI